jgi:hypothetical protein
LSVPAGLPSEELPQARIHALHRSESRNSTAQPQVNFNLDRLQQFADSGTIKAG